MRVSLALLYFWTIASVHAEEVQLAYGSDSTDLNLGLRLLIILAFLGAMAFLGYLITHFAKTGKLKIPELLLNKNALIKDLNINKNTNAYTMKLIHKQSFDDGSEMWVLEINDRHILVSKSQSSGFSFITDLKSGQISDEIETRN